MITIPIDNGVMVISGWGVLLILGAVLLLGLIVALLIAVILAARRRGERRG